MSEILKKFGYPGSLVKEYVQWYLLLRPQQVTLGAMVLVEKSLKTRYSEISQESFAEFADIVKQIEQVGAEVLGYDKINYLMLMMVDTQVHYHIVPRYSKDVMFNNDVFHDHGWPGLPKFAEINHSNFETFENLLKLLRERFAA